MRTPLLALLALALLARPGAAAASAPQGARATGADGHVDAELVLEREAVRPGEPFRVGVHFRMERGWHIYWRNAGESGVATQLGWQIDGARVGETRWPFPSVFSEADGFITTYGYSGEVVLFSEAVFAPEVEGEIEALVDVEFLTCKVQCIPGEVQLHGTVRVGGAGGAVDADARALFDEWQARVPRAAAELGVELEPVYSLSAIRPGDSFRAALALRGCTAPDARPEDCAGLMPGVHPAEHAFVPDRNGGVRLHGTGGSKPEFLAGGFLLTMTGRAPADPAGPEGERMRGVLALRRDGRSEYVEVDVPLPRAAAGEAVLELENPWLEPAQLADPALAVSLWRALLLGLLGGIVLNAMPCVLPVLAIKLVGVAELAHHRRAEMIRHGFAYLAGVLVSMLVLAAGVVALRAAGTSVGWGFQFQEPAFVAAISALLVLFALNLFGVFEIGFDATRLAGAGSSAVGARRSLFEGALAVAVATPCSAPFLGTAVGFAFASPPLVIAVIFLAIGTGLALPFVAVTLVPGWARFVPRGGAWMDHLRAALGFALLATVLWLVWVLGRTAGNDGAAALGAALLVLAGGAYVFGALQRAQQRGAARAVLVALGLLAVLGLRVLPLGSAEHAAAATAQRDAAPALRGTGSGTPFSRAAVDAALAAQRPAFVYFTADWCLTCKVNEHVVLADARVHDALAQLGAETFIGDWTRRDDAIRAELARFGRAGVPLYLIYTPGRPDQPIVLPELLTVDLLLNALRQAAPRGKEGTT